MNIVKCSEIKFMLQRLDFPQEILIRGRLLVFSMLLYAGFDSKWDIFMSNFQLAVQKFSKTFLY